MPHFSDDDDEVFDNAAEAVVKLGNQIMDADKEADPWNVASGVLAGAVHFWLYSHQPCNDPTCESCPDFGTAELRLRQLLEEIRQTALESAYYHSPNDTNAGRA